MKLSDNLRAGTVPCEQMGTNVPAAKSRGCSSGRGEGEQRSSVLVSHCPSLLELSCREERGHGGGVSDLGKGGFTAEVVPPTSSPWVLLLHP